MGHGTAAHMDSYRDLLIYPVVWLLWFCYVHDVSYLKALRLIKNHYQEAPIARIPVVCLQLPEKL
jgi:hypothetical protein